MKPPEEDEAKVQAEVGPPMSNWPVIIPPVNFGEMVETLAIPGTLRIRILHGKDADYYSDK